MPDRSPWKRHPPVSEPEGSSPESGRKRHQPVSEPEGSSPESLRGFAPCAEATAANRTGGAGLVPRLARLSAELFASSVPVRLGPHAHDRDHGERDQADPDEGAPARREQLVGGGD